MKNTYKNLIIITLFTSNTNKINDNSSTENETFWTTNNTLAIVGLGLLILGCGAAVFMYYKATVAVTTVAVTTAGASAATNNKNDGYIEVTQKDYHDSMVTMWEHNAKFKSKLMTNEFLRTTQYKSNTPINLSRVDTMTSGLKNNVPFLDVDKRHSLGHIKEVVTHIKEINNNNAMKVSDCKAVLQSSQDLYAVIKPNAGPIMRARHGNAMQQALEILSKQDPNIIISNQNQASSQKIVQCAQTVVEIIPSVSSLPASELLTALGF